MNKEKLLFSSKVTDIAEHDSYLELTSCMCYYDDSNLNGVVLPYKGFEEQAEAAKDTLINQPVQAKYRKINNQDDLGSHEVYYDSQTGEYEFLTESVGVHTSAWIEESTVTTVHGETKTLPCLFSTKRIWKRNKNMTNAIKRLYDSDGGLNSSWEIYTKSYTYEDGKKTLTDYEFSSDCLLGSTTTPAYKGTSKVTSLSALSADELMVAEALGLDMLENHDSALDINNNQDKEEEILKKNLNVSSEDEKVVVTPEVSNEETEINPDVQDAPETEIPAANVDEASTDEISNEETTTETEDETSEEEKDEETPEEDANTDTETSETEVSALTDYDIRRALNKACREKVQDWCWVSFVFPTEGYCLCEYDESESELQYLKFTYAVNGESVEVGEPEKVSLSVSVSSINEKISELENTISEKDELIVKASAEITELKAKNTELSQYKERLDEIEQQKVAEELAQKKEDLIASVVKSGQITKEEIETNPELSAYVDALDKKSLMALVGERLSASMENEVETSEVKNEVHVASNLNNEDDVLDAKSVMRKFLGK